MATLVKDTATLKVYIGADGSTMLESVNPQTTNAERTYIKKVIGSALYTTLLDGVEADDLTSDEEDLLHEVLQALVPLSFYLGSPIGSVRFGDTGMHTASTQDKERLPKWMFDNFRNQCCFDGFNAIERLYKYLEENTAADWYNAWAAGEGYTTYKSLLVNRADIMGTHVEINHSRWFFEKCLPLIRNTEMLFAAGAITTEQYADLLEKYSDDDLGTEEAEVVELLQKSISMMAYGKSLRDKRLIGEMLISTASRSEDVKTGDITLRDYDSLSMDYIGMAQGVMQQVISKLNAQASETLFAEWFASDKYKSPASQVGILPLDKRTNNQSSNGTFFMPR